MAQLVPVLCKPVVPGDRFKVSLAYQMQLGAMLNPVYDGVEVNFEAFFSPNRIIDPKWRDFWTGYNEYDQMTPVDVAPLTLRVMNAEGNPIDFESLQRDDNPLLGNSSLLDFIGYQFAFTYDNGFPVLPNVNSNSRQQLFSLNAFPIMHYHRIYDDWYRNERTQKASLYDWYNGTQPRNIDVLLGSLTQLDGDHLVDVEHYSTSSGVLENSGLLAFHYRNYAKDRFTTALPEPVIGGDVRIPVGEDGFNYIVGSGSVSSQSLVNNGSPRSVADVDGLTFQAVQNGSGSGGVSLNALALGTIQQLKLALKEYQYRMKDTYNGNRYVESIQSHFGVRVPDSTLQRSLYLGSARDYVNFGEVYQTSSGDGQGENGALGDYAGRGSAQGQHFMFDETFYEPGYIFVIMSISIKARYFQGVQRHLSRFERDDYFSPEYQNIGDDFLRNDEIFNDTLDSGGQPTIPGSVDLNTGVFGYNSRWYDLKSYHDELHGDFKQFNFNSQTGSLDYGPMATWTFTRAFESTPVISSEFSRVPIINRPFVDTDQRNDNFFVDMVFNIDALRPILAVESF